MKRIYTKIFIASLTAFLFVMTADLAQAQNESVDQMEEQLLGDWKINLRDSKRDNSQKNKDYMNRISDAQRQQVEDAFDGRVFKFSEDMVFEDLVKNGDVYTGTWRVTQEGKVLRIKYASGIVLRFDITLKPNGKVLLKAKKVNGKESSLALNVLRLRKI